MKEYVEGKSEIQGLQVVDINIIHLSYRAYLKVKQIVIVQSWDQSITVGLDRHRGIVLRPW